MLRFNRDPEDHISIRISRSRSKAQYRGDTRNHALQDPNVVLWGPGQEFSSFATGSAGIQTP